MDHLNYFYPYSADATHENQLTRAFLTTMKYVPFVQNLFIDMIREKMIEKNIEDAHVIPTLTDSECFIDTESIETQTTSIKQDTGRLISVLISNDEYKTEHEVVNTENKRIYDGVIYYKPEWVFIIENKPNKDDVWDEQLNPNLDKNSDIIIEKKPICLSWRKIFSRINIILDKELVSQTEMKLLFDFMRYVDKNFSSLNPFDNLAICKNDKYLLNQRCFSIMENLNLGKVGYHKSWKNYIHVDFGPTKQIAVAPLFDANGDWSLYLQFYTGDTMTQARQFFSRINKQKVFMLKEKGWLLQPNFHFAYQASNLLYSKCSLSIEEYIEFWMGENAGLSQINKDNWEQYQNFVQQLIQNGLMHQEDTILLKERFDNTKRHTLNVCAGIEFMYKWTKEEAIDLDRKGLLVDAVAAKIDEGVGTWGDSIKLL